MIEEDYYGTKKWNGTRICSLDIFKKLNVNNIRNSNNLGLKIFEIYDGGWHFSFLGGK